MQKKTIGPCTLYCGDSRDVLPLLDPVDAVVTDPPYGLSFMGKAWDYDVPDVDLWRAVFDAAKPGAHLLAFAGTRTQHRMAVNIEDAGWHIRDLIAWVYASGFPKSHDVSKAIDRAAGAERQVVGRSANGIAGGTGEFTQGNAGSAGYKAQFDITAPATDDARKWAGFGSAIKPSVEPLSWARKPFNVVPSCVMRDAETTIGAIICLSLSNAKHAATILTSSRHGPNAAPSVSAALIAAVLNMHASGASNALTAIFKSPAAAKTCLSIVLSWQSILVATCARQNTFTTSTATALTTALKTFNSLILPTMQECTQGENNRSLGQLLSARLAASSQNASNAHCRRNTIIAADVVTQLKQSTLADSAASGFDVITQSANSVLESAITNTGGGLVPDVEPISLCRKPLDGTLANNVLTHGTGALNIDGCRVPTIDDCARKKSLVADNAPCGFGKGAAMGGNGHDLGRWPANLIHDGSPDALQQLGDSARIFYSPKASKADRDDGVDLPLVAAGGLQGRNDGLLGTTTLSRNHHPTVKPTDLMRYLCRLIGPPGGVILDPFMGSGSTGRGAVLEGFSFIGIERDPEYFEIACKRIEAALAQPSLPLDLGGGQPGDDNPQPTQSNLFESDDQ